MDAGHRAILRGRDNIWNDVMEKEAEEEKQKKKNGAKNLTGSPAFSQQGLSCSFAVVVFICEHLTKGREN